MSESKTLYKQILQSTTLFGGVQVFNILVSVIRSKIIALLIGPEGMGIAALLNSAINLISGITSLGIETSSVKYISQENVEKDKYNLYKIIAVLRKMVWFTGILGALVTLVFSSWLSLITFGDTNYSAWFAWLSISLLLKQLSGGQLAMLQGFRKLKFLAKANFFGSLIGLLISIPFYYYLRMEAIVPAIVISSVAALCCSWYYAAQIKVERVKVANRQLLTEGKGMLKLGIMLGLSGIITTTVAYVIQIYVSDKGGLAEVGLYNAGMMLLNSYVGLIFTSMSTDYFPRLASVSEDKIQVQLTVTHQAMIAILIITPVIALFLAFAPLIVKILYSAKFVGIISMLCFGIVGMLFRAVSWSMGYILLAKGDSKMFIRTAFGFNALFFVLSICGYHFFGLMGLGIAFTIHYFFHFLLLKIITAKRYDFYFGSEFYRLFLVCILICGITFLVTFISHSLLRYSLMGVMILVSGAFSLNELNKKMDFMQIIDRIKGKIK